MFATLKSWLKPAARPARPVRLGLTVLEGRDVPAIVVPELSSKPDAPFTIYLDFDGQTVDNWGYWPARHSPGTVPAFSIDADTQNTSYDEYLAMGRAWHYVAEDYAPFNVNVTTVGTGSSPREDEGVRVIVGGSADDWYEEPAFGVAYLDDFFSDSAPKAFVFSEDIVAGGATGSMLAKVIGDVASHEAGHTLGLEHQSVYQSVGLGYYGRINEYRPAFADPVTGELRGVLMGNSYPARSTWGNGTYSQGALVMSPRSQDDMAILGSALGWRADEPTRNLGVVASGSSPWAQGIVGKTTDTDAFQFIHAGGPLSIEVTTLFEGSAVVPLAGNLDTRVTLTALGTRGAISLGTFSPNATLGVSTVVGLPPIGAANATLGQFTGQYILTVGSAGQYGDVGQYNLKLRYSTTAVVLPTVQLAGGTATAMSTTTATTVSGASAAPATSAPANLPVARESVGGRDRAREQAVGLPALIPSSRSNRIAVAWIASDDFELFPLHGTAV